MATVEPGRVNDSTSRPAPEPPQRRGILLVLYGRHAWRKIVLQPGQSITVGRTDKAGVQLDDHELSGQHFSIWFSGKRAVVRDLESGTGTAINGAPARGGVIEHGGFVVAGDTTFQLFLEGFTSPGDPPDRERFALLGKVRELLGPADGRLYGVFDAAREDRVRWMLQESVDEHQNLYEGIEGRALDDVAPYLVRFASDSDLVDRLLHAGWGEAWGFFFRSDDHPKEVRRHLRRFLMVKSEESADRMYFRFYDPRVLREFLGVATPRQYEEILSPFQLAVFEGEDGQPLSVAKPRKEVPDALDS